METNGRTTARWSWTRLFFLVNFTQKENYNKALHEGPWFISGHFLAIRQWQPCFSFTALWVRLPELPTKFYDLSYPHQDWQCHWTATRNECLHSKREAGPICQAMHSGPPWFATHHIGIHWKVSPESPIQKNQSIVLPLWQDRAIKPQLRLQTPPTPAIPHQTSSSLQPTPDNHNAASAPKSTNMSTSIGPAQPEGTTISPSQIYKSYTANTSTNQAHLPLQQSTSSLSPHSTSTDLSLTHAPSEANTNPLDSGYGPWMLVQYPKHRKSRYVIPTENKDQSSSPQNAHNSYQRKQSQTL